MNHFILFVPFFFALLFNDIYRSISEESEKKTFSQFKMIWMNRARAANMNVKLRLIFCTCSKIKFHMKWFSRHRTTKTTTDRFRIYFTNVNTDKKRKREGDIAERNMQKSTYKMKFIIIAWKKVNMESEIHKRKTFHTRKLSVKETAIINFNVNFRRCFLIWFVYIEIIM